jgi:sensor histidine kinase YesM
MFYQHIFIFGMHANYILVLHSFAAMVMSHYGSQLTAYNQIIFQNLIYSLLLFLTLYPIWKLLKNSFIFNLSMEDTYYWNVIWLIPVLLCVSELLVTVGMSWISTWQQIVSRILTGAAAFVSWKVINLHFNNFEEKIQLKSTNHMLSIQMKALHHQAETIRENDEKLRILKHDLRHHVHILSSLLQNGDTIHALDHLKQLDNQLDTVTPVIFCNNLIINSALIVYLARAKEYKINISSEMNVPENIPFDSNDIAILFANVLENAIQASLVSKSDHREIHISSKYVDSKLVIMVKNRFEGKVSFNDDGMPISMETGHGIGMQSIHALVKKYSGHVVCSHKDNWFTISFMFSAGGAHENINRR